MTPAISVARLSRRYRGQSALDHVSFDIEPGSITGLLGRNGAGKTTLLRILAGAEFDALAAPPTRPDSTSPGIAPGFPVVVTRWARRPRPAAGSL
jgi:ATPase subunit of ABC transporter with duplicated ATPase domains